MDKQKLLEVLEQTLADYRLSRGEKKAVKDVVDHYFASEHDLAVLRSEVFKMARAELVSPEAKSVLEWLEEIVKVLVPHQQKEKQHESAAYFSTQDDCVKQIQRFIWSANKTLDICVFTITDDRITDEILDAHKQKIKIRIVTDDDKSTDRGSDIRQLKNHGINIRMDATPDHMHHKYAIADGERLLNGSYNWTRSAAISNEENFTICNDEPLVQAFSQHFEKIWDSLK